MAPRLLALCLAGLLSGCADAPDLPVAPASAPGQTGYPAPVPLDDLALPAPEEDTDDVAGQLARDSDALQARADALRRADPFAGDDGS